ncbi:MAG TPA: pyridoxal phosphate-dependent aminotransferase [Bacteroidales bacterium]|nr:pyridoxal phosphate-dependent aminotransferase [Bacteroidales bacterium]
MPKISERGHAMPASPIRKLVPFAEKAKEKGRKVYHLNIGQPDIKTPEHALNAIKNLKETVIEYSHSAGNESYRRKLAKKYYEIDIKVDHTEIMITTGGSEAISFALMSTINPGEEVICPEPFYANYNGFSTAAGVNVVPVTSDIDSGFSLPPIEEFEKLITPKTRGIIICNPNNPTGYLYSESEMRQLGEIIKKHDLYLYSDEVYREFCYDGKIHFSAMSLPEVEQNVIMIDSISKRYSMCGARVGALVTKNRQVLDTALKFAQARLSPPSFGQIAGEAALDTPTSYFDEVYQEYIERRNFMVKALNEMPGVKCPTPGGAFYTTVHLPVKDTDNFARWILSDFEYENQTIMMAPASGFYSTPGFGKQEVRIAYVLNKEELKKAMQVLAEALRVYPDRL